jgi:hypothetical protein
MEKKFKKFAAALVVLATMIVMAACSAESTDEGLANPVSYLKRWWSSLTHDVTINGDKASDDMSSTATYVVGPDSTTRYYSPSMDVAMQLSKENYRISADQVEIAPNAQDIVRKDVSEGTVIAEKDSVFFFFPDGQKVTLPANISSGYVELGGKKVPFGSLRLESSSCFLKNDLVSTRSNAVDSVVYNTTYTADVNFREVNANDSLIKVRLQKQTLRYVISSVGIDTIYVENVTKYPLTDSTTVYCFDKVVKSTTGDSTIYHKEFILPYYIKGIDPWEKFVEDFGYDFSFTNGLRNGGEESFATGYDNLQAWKVYGKYSSVFKNGVDSDVVSDYTTMDCRAIFDDGEVHVVWDAKPFTITENRTFVEMMTSNKSGYDMAALKNLIDGTYMGRTQSLSETVYLYKRSSTVLGHDVVDAKLVVEDEVVKCSLIYRTLYTDGRIDSLLEKRSFPRDAVSISDWLSYEKSIMPCLTDTTLSITTTGMTESTDGHWNWKNITRNVKNNVTLNASTQTNIWRITEPTEITYSNGDVAYTFVLTFKVSEFGNNYVLADNTGGVITYDYTDNIRISVNENTKSVAANGKIIINGKEIVGYEGSAEQLTITPNSVIAKAKFVTKYVDETETVEFVEKTIQTTLEPTTNWTAYEGSNMQNTGAVSYNVLGSENVTDGEWSWSNVKRALSNSVALASSTQTNGWTSIVPNHIVFERNGVRVDFGEIGFNPVKVSDNVTLRSKELNVDTYDYTCTVRTDLTNPKAVVNGVPSATAPGTIVVTNAVTIIGHDVRNMQLKVYDNEVVASLEYISYKSDGTEDVEKAQMSFPKNVVCTSNWLKKVASANQSTGSASYSLSSSSAEEVGYWKYTREVYFIKTIASLDFATVQAENTWEATLPNSIVYARDEKEYAFQRISFTATENGATLVEKEANDAQTVFAYTDNISVTCNENTVKSTAPGTVIVEVTVTNKEAKNKELVINENDVTASFDYVVTYSNGKVTTDKVSKSIPLSHVCTTNWNAKENRYSEQTSQPDVALNGSSAKSEGEWSWTEQTREIDTKVSLYNSTQTNSWTSKVPNNIVCVHDGLRVEFGEIAYSVTKQPSQLSLVSSSDNVSVYKYTDHMTIIYGGKEFAMTAPGKLTIEVAVSGHEIKNKTIEVTADKKVHATLTWVTKYTDDSTTEEIVEKWINLKVEELSNWTSTEENANQTTGAANQSLTSSSTKKDGDWAYVEEVYGINTVATLNASNQTNSWRATVPNRISYTREGQTANFDVLSLLSHENGATTTKISDNQYSYKDNIVVTYGGRDFAATAKGTINIEEAWNPDFPSEWGKFKNMVTTCAPSTDNSTYVYTHSLHFDNGTLLIVEEKDNAQINGFDASMFTNDTNPNLNGGCYRRGSWVHSIATDQNDYMLWSNSDNSAIRSLNYITATTMNWNRGHNTVMAHGFSYQVANNVLTIKKDGSVHGTFKLVK